MTKRVTASRLRRVLACLLSAAVLGSCSGGDQAATSGGWIECTDDCPSPFPAPGTPPLADGVFGLDLGVVPLRRTAGFDPFSPEHCSHMGDRFSTLVVTVESAKARPGPAGKGVAISLEAQLSVVAQGMNGKVWIRRESSTFLGIVDNAMMANIRNTPEEALIPIGDGYVRIIDC